MFVYYRTDIGHYLYYMELSLKKAYLFFDLPKYIFSYSGYIRFLHINISEW